VDCPWPTPARLASPFEATWAGGHVNGMLLEGREWDDLQGLLMAGGEDDVRCSAVVVGAQPVRGSHTPAISGHQAGKMVLGHRRREVVADTALVLEELGGHHRADGVAAKVLAPGGTAPVSVEASEGVR